jgi:hypothetical protein
MKHSELNHKEMQFFWLVGVLERLSTLGYLQGVPYVIPPDSVDMFLSLNPNDLFASAEELQEALHFLIMGENEPEEALETLQEIHHLVLEYKKDPFHLVKHGLENSI